VSGQRYYISFVRILAWNGLIDEVFSGYPGKQTNKQARKLQKVD
jgi:hypothetical protein